MTHRIPSEMTYMKPNEIIMVFYLYQQLSHQFAWVVGLAWVLGLLPTGFRFDFSLRFTWLGLACSLLGPPARDLSLTLAPPLDVGLGRGDTPIDNNKNN